MNQDPFGNLTDWGSVLEMMEDLSERGELSQCQAGIIRILRYKGNWRLREEAVKRAGDIQNPSNALARQVLDVLDDDNIYYDARILAGNALMRLLKKDLTDNGHDIYVEAKKVIEKLKSIPQPPFFEQAVQRIDSEIGDVGRL